MADDVRNGDHVRVTGGTHQGKSGIVQDRRLSRTGHVTITVVQDDGIRLKTLAKNVAVQPR